ncbi:MAG TPA: hypothetical protein VF458_22735 [Ktedonobacteraceae bacterium]
MKVILHIFSGRPDPSWELTEEEDAELARRLMDLPPTHHMLPEGGLGYSGFTLDNLDKLAGLPAEVQVFQGIIGVWENGYPTYYQDLCHLEAWLIERGRKLRYYGDLLNHLLGNN